MKNHVIHHALEVICDKNLKFRERFRDIGTPARKGQSFICGAKSSKIIIYQ
jgi:hypothetical protein